MQSCYFNFNSSEKSVAEYTQQHFFLELIIFLF